ncbi:MAG: CD225/dispanin family protein [Bacteroidales bacterium]|nr:CD225/dispanin family protein [Bacteroidales bacterium]
MKIWIHLNGTQEGPYDLEALPLARMDASTPVWYEGLADWLPAGQAPATASLFAGAADEPKYDASAQSEPQRQESYSYQSYQWAQRQPAHEEHAPKCPPTFFVWSILLTVVCCNPVGIIPIITGASTMGRYRNRNFEGARRMSRTTEWWIMITIVTSLIMFPFTLLTQAL